MKMREILILGIFCVFGVSGQCTFPSPWASSTWLDSTHGTITFTTTTMSGWSTTVFSQAVNTWQCLDSSSSTTLVMRSTNAITYSTTSIYVFLCIKLTQITTNSYSYVQQQVAQPNAGYDRLWFSTDGTLSDVSIICDTSASIPTLEFHVLVKDGIGDSAAITFPNNLLFSADYQYMTSTGTVACNGTADTMDMCTDKTALSFNNYTNCKQEIAYSAGGELWCVAKASLGSYDCAVVLNRDATITGTASRFACLCSDGSSVSVVSGNCTSDMSPSAYPTAADGTTVIGYRLTIESVYVNCAPSSEGSSSSSNAGLIAGIVIVLLIIIVVIIVSIILYKRGHCVTVCDCVNRCLEKTPCWATCGSKVCVCCKNKVAESEKPMLANGTGPHVETVDETSSRPKVPKEKTSLSAITRASSVAGKREKSELEKSLIRQGTVTSITGIEVKSARSSVQQIHVKSTTDDEDEKEPRLKLLGLNLSFLVCCPQTDKEIKNITVDKEEPEMPPVTEQKKPTKATGKKGAKSKGGKSGKKEKKSQEQKTVKKSQNQETEKKQEVEKKQETEKKQDTEKTKNGITASTEVENGRMTRAPTKMKSDLLLTSTPVPGGERGQKGVVSVPVGLIKPEDKPTEWTFLSCCYGNRSPPPEDKTVGPEPESVQKENGHVKPAAKTPTKGKGAGAKKAKAGAKKVTGKKGKAKEEGKKTDANENDLIEEDLTIEAPPIQRSKTMPEREKTSLSLQDAQAIKIDVYIPDDKTKLQLKDTVTVVNGEPKLEKAKTEIGLTRPPSSRPASSVKAKGKKGKSDKKADKKADEKANKGKEGGKKGSKDKKGGKKKK